MLKTLCSIPNNAPVLSDCMGLSIQSIVQLHWRILSRLAGCCSLCYGSTPIRCVVIADMGSIARDSVHSDDYVGNSPMSAGLQRLSGQSAFQPGSPTAPLPSATSTFPSGPVGGGQPMAARPSSRFVTESTPQTMGTAGGLPVAPDLATATGHANIPSISGTSAAPYRPAAMSGNVPPQQVPAPFVENQSAGGVPVQHSAAEEFPAQEELTVDSSASSAPSMFGQMRPGRLGMPDTERLKFLHASAVAAAFPGPSQNVDTPAGHHHAFEKAGVVLARPADGTNCTVEQQQLL